MTETKPTRTVPRVILNRFTYILYLYGSRKSKVNLR
jgi:hypothetical protein